MIRPPAWWVIPGSALLLASVAVQIMLIRVFPDYSWGLIDAAVYRGGGSAVRAGASLYGQDFGHLPLPFTYPPFAALLFVPLSVLSLDGAGAVLLVVSLGSVAGTIWLLLGARGYAPDGSRLGATAGLTAMVMWWHPFQAEANLGQVNAMLMLLVVADLTRRDQARLKGVGVGLAAGIKLVPGIFVLYLLLTRRRRAAAVATGTFAATVALGAVVAPRASWQYWSGAFADADRVAAADGPSSPFNQSLYAFVLRALGGHGIPATTVWLVLASAVLVGGLWLARYAYHHGDDLAGVLTAGLVGLLVSPISWSYAWVWLAVGMVLSAEAVRRLAGRAQLLAAAVPTLIMLALLAWPMTSGQRTGTLHLKPIGLLGHVPKGGAEFHWSAGQWVMGNVNLLVGAGMLVAVVLWLRQLRQLRDGSLHRDQRLGESEQALGA